MDDLMVIGYDLATGQPVHVQDQPPSVWRRKGYGGTGDLICWHCWLGHEAAKGSRVPLVTKGKIDGRVRTHFAHPTGRAPIGGHSLESLFHSTAKADLSRWASRQRGVTRAVVEASTDDRSRRADVMAYFDNGKRVAIEVQISDVSDDQWRARHADYQTAGIVDVWIWRTGMRAGVARDAGLPVWLLDKDGKTLWTPVASAHNRRWGWWESPDRQVHCAHWPACVGDKTRSQRLALDDCSLTPDGIAPPRSFAEALDDDWRQTLALAEKARSAPLPAPTSSFHVTEAAAAPSAAPRPEQPVTAIRSTRVQAKCVVCGLVLDEILVKHGRHFLC